MPDFAMTADAGSLLVGSNDRAVRGTLSGELGCAEHGGVSSREPVDGSARKVVMEVGKVEHALGGLAFSRRYASE